LIKENTNWLSKYNDKAYSLNITKYRQDKKLLRNTIKTIDSLSKLQTPLEVVNLAVDLQRISGDKNKEERNTAFINRLKNDLHLGETVNVMNDMIQQYYIAQNKLSDSKN
jgi:carboxyl-terminal processing protease